MQIPRRKSDELRQRDDGPVHLTKEGLSCLEEELARIRRDLPGLIAEAQRTAAYGDRSDSAEYKEAKYNLRRANWRVISIEDQLKRVEVIDTGPNASGVVCLGSTVVLKDGDTQKTFQIVGPRETNPEKGRISHLSPLGSALIGREKGDSVDIATSNGIKKYHIDDIN